MFYELLTGQVPAGHFDPPSQRAGIDPRLDSIVLRLLAREPARRFREIEALSTSAGIAVPPVTPQHQGGLSALIDREVLGAWRWATGTSAPAGSHTPSHPGTWMILLCLAGGLSILAPWITLHVDKGADLRNSHDSGFVAENAARMIYGHETAAGAIMTGILALLALVLVMTPTTRPISSLRGLMLILLSTGALLAASLFVYEARSSLGVAVPFEGASDRRFDAESGESASRPPGVAAETPRPGRSGTVNIVVWRLPHRVSYHFGFYAGIGSSVVLLVLSGMSTRRAASHGNASPAHGPGSTPATFLTEHRRPAVEAPVQPAPHVASDLAMIRAEVDLPSLALLVVGGLTSVLHSAALVSFLGRQSEASVWICLPGIATGCAMLQSPRPCRSVQPGS